MTLLRDQRTDEGTVPSTGASVRYEDDGFTWALQQAALLKAGRTDALDLENLADEITAVAGREYDKLEGALSRVLQHLLKWDHQTERRSRSWVLTTKEHRRRVSDQLGDHPGLKAMRDQALDRAYRRGRSAALSETDLPEAAIPESLPYSWDEVMGRPVAWPQDA